MDVHNTRIDSISFTSLDIRNRGSMITHNGGAAHTLTGRYMRVYPGGLLEATNVRVNVHNLTVDVMGAITGDHGGYCHAGKGGGGHHGGSQGLLSRR
jgi:hypothetical protein